MDWLTNYFHFIFHIDTYLSQLLQYFGNWTYLILFAIVFCESGIILTPFLPGESLLFAIGTLSATGAINVNMVIITLCSAAVIGGFVNYCIGFQFGKRIIVKTQRSFIHKYLMQTQEFYEKHGNKTILIARLIPFVRTYAPFLAGAVKMNFSRFLIYNIIGGIVWITCFIYISYYFGHLPFIKNNLSYVIIGIVVVSVMPIVVATIKSFRRPSP